MNANLRILLDLRSLNHLPVWRDVGDTLAELVVNRLPRASTKDERSAGAEIGDSSEVFGCCRGGFRSSARRGRR